MLLHTTLSFSAYQEEYRHDNCGEQRNCKHMADAPDQRIGTALSKRTQPTQEAGTQPEPQPELQPSPAAEPILMTRFYAKGTKAQLIGLKHYLEKEGIEYGNL